MVPGVVVLLEQVTQEQRGAAVGAAQLQASLDPPFTLALEPDEEREQRDDEQRSGGLVDRSERRQQAERREQQSTRSASPSATAVTRR